MKVALSLDDFSVINNRMDLLLKIKEHYPNFKVSLFTIPFHVEVEKQFQFRVLRDKYLKQIKENLDWMEIIPHGLTHMPKELENCDYYTFRDGVLPSIDEALRKDGLPYVKGFKAPYWLWSEGVVRALDEAGWWGASDRNQPDMLKTKKDYVYTHSLEETFYLSKNDEIRLHGHIDGVSANDLERCFLNVFKLPEDTEFVFVSDLMK